MPEFQFKMPKARATLIAVALAMSSPAMAQPAPSVGNERAGRFTMSPADGGFMRIDTENGSMSLCTKRLEKWACEPIGDDNGSNLGRSERDELARLRIENAELRVKIKNLEDLVLGPETTPRPTDKPSGKLQLPTEQDVDGALDYVERMFKKFRDRLRQLEGTEKTTPL